MCESRQEAGRRTDKVIRSGLDQYISMTETGTAEKEADTQVGDAFERCFDGDFEFLAARKARQS